MSRRWGVRAGFALADQVTVAVAGLGLQVTLGRLLAPDAYGAFAVVYTLLSMLLGVHTALVSEPMTILASSRTGADRNRLVGGFLRWHHRLVLATTGLALAIAGVLWGVDGPAGTLVFGLAVAIPGFLLFHVLRRVAYLSLNASRALVLSLTFAIVLALALATIVAMDLLSPLSALIALGGATGLGAVVRFARQVQTLPRTDWRSPAREGWAYGRWILGANLAHWLGLGVYVPAVGSLLGLGEAGAFRALQNLVAPVQQGLAAAGLLALPWLTRRAGESGVRSGAVRLAALTLLPAMAYAVLLAIFGETWVSLLYDQASYTRASGLLVLFAGIVVILPLNQSFAIAVRASGRPYAVFWSKAAAAVVTIGGGFPLIRFLGLRGAVLGLLISQATETMVLGVLFIRGAPQGESAAEATAGLKRDGV